MGRLIDADALIEFIDAGHLRHPSELCFSELDVVNMLNHAPTSYDVEKVVAEIKKKHCQKCRNILSVPGAEEYCKEQKCRIDEICDIVKRGGVE